ncbi:MAG: sensor histidine kinase [Acidimicrobiales bacterium]
MDPSSRRRTQVESDCATRLAELERDCAARLAELDGLKASFVASVSHELRTPVTSILGWATTLRARSMPPERQAEYLALIERESRRLAGLVEAVLDLKEPPGSPAGHTAVDLGALLREIASEELAAGRELLVDAPDGLLAGARAAALRRSLTCLLDNAFTHGGGEVTVRAAPARPGARSLVELTVADRGPGIPRHEACRVLEPFERGAATFLPGLGIGLYLAKSLAESEGGRLWLTERPGGGTLAHIELPAPAP